MNLKLNKLATVVTCAFATACAVQPKPMTTETSTTQSQPTTSETQPATTTQTTTTQTQSPATSQPETTETQASTTTQTTTETQQTTSESPATDKPAAAPTDQVTKATADDIKAGASVYDQTGALVGKVVSVDKDGAIVNTGKARAKVPLSGFGKNDKGLVISVTKADFDAQVMKEAKPKS